MKRYTAQDYRKLKRLWLKWACDFTYENIKRLEKFFPERSVYSVALHLMSAVPYLYEQKDEWLKFENDYKRVKMKEQKERRGKALTQAQKIWIMKKYNYKCGFCGYNLNRKDYRDRVEFDHIIPLMKGGTNKSSNYRPVHYKCHKNLHRIHHKKCTRCASVGW